MTVNFKAILVYFFLMSGIACKKNDNNASSTFPAASINNLSQERTKNSSIFAFKVLLDKAASKEVTIHYATIAGSAVENMDFKPSAGIITIPANQLSATINIEVTGDSLRKFNQFFSVQLDNPQNCTIITPKATGSIVNENGLYFPVDNAGYTTPATYPGYTLKWSDEFSGSAIDGSSWKFESGNNNGWGNNELEYYTDRPQNVFQSQGNLIIEARRESFTGYQYTSTRMVTKNKRVFKFGRIDIRAKMPSGKGIWPALWMLGNNIDQAGWPACGEIDILELLGQEPNKIYGTLHWGATVAEHASKGSDYVASSGSFDQQFHVFSLIWQQDSIKILIDDNPYITLTAADVSGNYPFNSDFFFIFNVATGGSWPGSPDSTTGFPQRMVVDYIRVFQ